MISLDDIEKHARESLVRELAGLAKKGNFAVIRVELLCWWDKFKMRANLVTFQILRRRYLDAIESNKELKKDNERLREELRLAQEEKGEDHGI